MADTDAPIICHKCGVELHAGQAQFYVVRIEAFADPSPPDFTEEDLCRGSRREIRRLIDGMADLSEQEAMDQVHRKMSLCLCNGCYRDWIENPTGRNLTVIPLTDAQKIEYFHRSYKTVDGLWFVKCEERYGFDEALDLDDAVWQVIPKIQARKIKEFTGLTEGLDALRECFTTRLELEGFVFTVETQPDGESFAINVGNCPWQNLLAKAGRTHLGVKIGDRICRTECRVWAAEFGRNITYEFGERICQGTGQCVMRFKTQ